MSRLDTLLSVANVTPYILVIEDDETIREVVGLILADEGFDVGSAGNISAALHLIQERRPDLILLDLTLPGPGGEGFVAAYRRLPDATAPIVIMSGRADIQHRFAAIGADRVLPKPFEVDDLVDVVRTTLAERDARAVPASDAQSAPTGGGAASDVARCVR